MKLYLHSKLLILVLVLPFVTLASTNTDKAKTTKEKTITKSFNVSPNATLEIDNSFGSLDVVTWNENRIDIDVIIKVTGNNSEKINERINSISVEFDATNTLVSAKTKISKNEKNWWNWGKKMNLKLEINYRIKMPITNNIDLNNDYGNIKLDLIEGTAKLSCDYGKITTKELMADDNDISFDYSKGCYFEYINGGEISADFSGFTIAKTKNIDLNADYTRSVIEASENVKYNCDYGSLTINNINTLEGNGDYLGLKLGNVFKSLDLKADYGSVKIERMASKASNVVISSEFVGITIGVDAEYNFDFDFDMEHGSLRGSDNLNITSKNINGADKRYEGYHGIQNSGNTIKIDSEFGSITFKKN